MATENVNSWLEEEMYLQYRHDKQAVDASWKQVFDANGRQAGDQLVPMRGAARRIAENMTASLAIPVASSQRVIPVRVLELNRRLLNQHRKISYTHVTAWAVVRALEKSPVLNHAYAEANGDAFRVTRDHVNIGIAVDVAGKDGARSIKVPNIKNAQSMSFVQFADAFDDIVARARAGKLTLADFEGTTISLTNPGTVGTMGSMPRLMQGQGAILATGAIDYPPEYRLTPADVRTALGLSKVMAVTCTYDHRIIQGAESGAFLGRLEELLSGEDGFYERMFADLNLPYPPVSAPKPVAQVTAAPAPAAAEAAREAAMARLIAGYRRRGHLGADLDPLGTRRPPHPDLDPLTYGLDPEDAVVQQALERLRATYCGTIGVQYMHIDAPEERAWLEQRMEPTLNQWLLDPATRRRILDRLIEAEGFETFLHTRFLGHKRFSMEGGESMIAMFDELLGRAADGGVEEAVIGMSHRGRLTILANIVGKSMVQLFGEFEGGIDPDSIEGSGDVKYHLGASGAHRSAQGREIRVSVAFNPSHLEAVNPVVEGIARPKQDRMGDVKRERVIPILMHGDAALAGQGVVAETLNLSRLEGYTTGGTIHLVVNNQIGFTTDPESGRSTTYCTDVALMLQSPVFHVNGDDPEACVRATQLALDYRQRFHKDVVVDMICYRKHGHNEADDPSYTQPLLYRRIRAHAPVASLYAERLEQENLVTAADVEAARKRVTARLNSIYDEAQQHKEQYELQEISAVPSESFFAPVPHTHVERDVLEHIIHRITTFPSGFRLHPKLRGFIEKRRQSLTGAPVDWALGETLAFGSLVLEGTPVRLSGQDVGRGTFSQRHVNFHDSEDGRMYCPLQHLDPGQARFEAWNSPLSEYAAMGFEFGFSAADPLTLVLWEAQFGDFANGAQIVIDQFLAAGESKWGQPNGLVLLLPHGQEGQGPEHSSSRLERFLQLSAVNNIQVANCTTPAQYFHLLRRQMFGGQDRRGVRKPLVILTPKSVLRHPKAVSTLEDLTGGSFQPVLADPPNNVRKVLLCSGKVYFDLAASPPADVAIVRLEQLYPFPEQALAQALAGYPAKADVAWVQEEPRNMGAWFFVRERIEPLLGERALGYAGRHESASPSPGSLKRHQQEQAELVAEAFAAGPVMRRRTRLVRRRSRSGP